MSFRRIGALVLALLLSSSCAAASGSGGPEGSPGAAAATTATGTVPAPDGPGRFAVATSELELVDPTRDRSLPVTVWYPARRGAPGTGSARYPFVPGYTVTRPAVAVDAPAADGTFGLVVFSHGSGASRFEAFELTEALAAHGFVVAAPDHPGNTFASFGDADGLARTPAERPRDVRLLIDRMLAGAGDLGPAPPWAGHLDGRVAVVGHSYGGYTALAVAGGSAAGGPADRRVGAVVALAPASSLLDDADLAAVDVPLLVMGGTADTTTPVDPDSRRPFALARGADRHLAVVTGANHNAFSVLCSASRFAGDPASPDDLRRLATEYLPAACGGDSAPPSRVQPAVNRYVVAFLLAALEGDGHARDWLGSSDGVTVTDAG